MTLLEVSTDPQYSRPATDEDRARWLHWDKLLREEPEYLSFLKQEEPDLYDALNAELAGLAIKARSQEWRDPTPGIGGRPEQLIPGTPGSFSDRTDWFTFLLVGGRGSGKSRTGAEAVREYCLGRQWNQSNPYFALVGKRLDDVRVNMVENTLLKVLPPGSVRKWNRATVELWLHNGVYLRGFSSAEPENCRGPNLVGAWVDEFAVFEDSDRSPAADSTTLSNLKMALRDSDGGTWKPRMIMTTTPKSVAGLRNIDPDDELNPGIGIYDDPSTVVSNMSTLANIDNLSPHFLEQVVKPLEGTRLYEQEVLGHLIDASLGALWSPELIDRMFVPPSYPAIQGRGFQMIVIGVDPSVNEGMGDECGIVVSGLANDGNAYILNDLSKRCPAREWATIVGEACRDYGADAIVVETNNGGELVTEVMGRDYPNLPIVDIHAKRGKKLRAEPVSLLSERGKVRLAAPRTALAKLTHQMKTWTGEDGEDSPDRIDAAVYSILYLLPPYDVESLIKVRRRGIRR